MPERAGSPDRMRRADVQTGRSHGGKSTFRSCVIVMFADEIGRTFSPAAKIPGISSTVFAADGESAPVNKT